MWSTEKYDSEWSKNPFKVVKRIIFLLILVSLSVSAIGYFVGWFAEAGEVTQEEFGPRASLEKYEWFKDCAATIEEKQSTIRLYESNVTSMAEMYGDTPIQEWDHLDKMQYNQWKTEISGIKASYNKVVKEYNSQSSKFNWELYNTEDLPTEFTIYIDH